MKGWLRAWLRVNWDYAIAITAFVCLAVAVLAQCVPLGVAGIALAAIAIGTVWPGKPALYRMCLHLPLVKRHLHRRWVRNARLAAAIQRDPRRHGFCWNKELAGIEDREALAGFVNDIHLLDRLLGGEDIDDEARKELGSE